MSKVGHGAKDLHERAQRWSHPRRLRKVQEECGELIAAINRYLENPTPENETAVAEEFEGVRITFENVRPGWADVWRKVRPKQLARLRNALEREGL